MKAVAIEVAEWLAAIFIVVLIIFSYETLRSLRVSDTEKLEYAIPYLRDMVSRGDDEAKFLLRMFGDNWEEDEDE